MRMMNRILLWLLITTAILFLITGFGITEYRTVEAVTFGLLTKPLAFKLHFLLWIPFVVLLAWHMLHKTILRTYRKFNGDS